MTAIQRNQKHIFRKMRTSEGKDKCGWRSGTTYREFWRCGQFLKKMYHFLRDVYSPQETSKDPFCFRAYHS